MLDFLVGLDTEFSDMVDGSHLYFPSAVQVEDVVLPQDQKKLIVETVENFAAYKKVRKNLGLDKTGKDWAPAYNCCRVWVEKPALFIYLYMHLCVPSSAPYVSLYNYTSIY